MKIIKNANVVTEYGILWDGSVKLEGDSILEVKKANEMEIPSDAENERKGA